MRGSSSGCSTEIIWIYEPLGRCVCQRSPTRRVSAGAPSSGRIAGPTDGVRRGEANLYPAEALNIPTELHSHGLRELAAVESARGSFDDARSALRRATGVEIGKRQVEQLAGRAAVDFAAYYERPTRTPADDGDVLVLSADGKGIVMRSDALRPATAKAAAKATGKLKTRLSKGEKRNRKRMAEVGAVYDVTPVVRNPIDCQVPGLME